MGHGRNTEPRSGSWRPCIRRIVVIASLGVLALTTGCFPGSDRLNEVVDSIRPSALGEVVHDTQQSGPDGAWRVVALKAEGSLSEVRDAMRNRATAAGLSPINTDPADSSRPTDVWRSSDAVFVTAEYFAPGTTTPDGEVAEGGSTIIYLRFQN